MSPSSELMGRARQLLRARLSDASVAHCERTAHAAVDLARRFGVDPAQAELAGLLHDYARDENDSELLEAAAVLGVPVIPFERQHPALLHARVGAAQVRRDLPGCGESVLSAIAVHTAGGVPMSDLDKVIYVADMVESGRAFPGVEAIRAACADEGLDECFRLAYSSTLRHLKTLGRPVHPISSAVSAAIEQATGRPLSDVFEVRR